jgi:hypothetical protein
MNNNTAGPEMRCRPVSAVCSKEGTWSKKVKVKFTLEQATKSQKGTRGIALLFP